MSRFWSKVSKAKHPKGCWLWTAGTISSGYGNFWVKPRMQLAHRVAYFVTHGVLPDEMDVLHTCDNPRCVNPAHLFLGDAKKNAADMMAKGRGGHGVPFIGAATPNAKLNDAKVRQIREDFSTGKYSKAQLGRDHSVSRHLIYLVLTRKIWKHVL